MSETTTSMPAIGKPAPRFHLPASTGTTVNLADYIGKKPVVLYFYPKADTPGCTKEACGFRDRLPEYDQSNVAVLGISPDSVEDVTKFATKFNLTFPLLADADHSIAEAYGVWGQKTMAGNTYMGVHRTTFLIAKDGTIRHVFEKVKPEGHDAEVLAWLKQNP